MAKAVVYFFALLSVLALGLPIVELFINNLTLNSLIINQEILTSMLYAASSSLLATLTALICAFLLSNSNYKTLFFPLLLTPLFISNYIYAVAFDDIFKLSKELSTILVHAITLAPIAIIITLGAINRINASLLEASMLITTPLKTVTKIIMPLLMPTIWLSLVIIFIFSLNEFSVPSYFGVETFTTSIFTQFAAFYDIGGALSNSLTLWLISLLAIILSVKALPKLLNLELSNSKSWHKPSRTKEILLATITIFFLLPLFTIFFKTIIYNLELLPSTIAMMRSSIGNSILIGLLGASAGVLIGYKSAWLKVRHNNTILESMLLFAFIAPSTTFAISLLSFYNTPTLSFIYSSFTLLLIGFVARFGFIASSIIEHGYKQIPDAFDESAMLVGATKWRRFSKITLPLMLPSIGGAFIILFTLIVAEIGMSIVLYPAGSELMNIKLYTITANSTQAQSETMVVINLLATLLAVAIFTLFSRRFYAKA